MIQNIQSLRFLLIIQIVLSHIIGKEYDYGGEVGVAFFFIISGFVMSLAYGNKVVDSTFSTRATVIRQLRKFYPLHVVMLLIAVALDYRLGIIPEWYRLLPNLLLLQSWIPIESFYYSFNAPSWFLCDIIFCYIAFRTLYAILSRLSTKHHLLLFAAICCVYLPLASMVRPEDTNTLLYVPPMLRLIDFSLGIMLCLSFRNHRLKRLSSVINNQGPLFISLMELLAVASMVVFFFLYQVTPAWFRCAAMLWFLSIPILFLFITTDGNNGIVTRIFHTKPMLYLGSISMEVFITHIITLRLFRSFASNIPDLNTSVIFCITSLTAILIVAGFAATVKTIIQKR